MNKHVWITLALILISTVGLSQVPELFSYRATVYGKDSLAYANKTIVVEISIQDSRKLRKLQLYDEYLEIHNCTNNQGGFNLKIGDGQSQKGNKSLGEVDWASGEKFLKVVVFSEAQVLSSGITRLMSVPYAIRSPFWQQVSFLWSFY
ncbi:MAG: hypothetical protein R2773_06285 [Flavobacteriaceae bacterium]